MVGSRTARIQYLARKATHLAPQMVARPRLISLALRGVHLGEFMNLDIPWFRAAGINTIVDVGANTGQFSSAVHAILPNATLYAFEPVADCFRSLEHRFASAENIHVFNVAIGAEDGEVELHHNNFSESSSILEMTDLHRQEFPWTVHSVPERVALRRLDGYLSELTLKSKVLVKIDVQGYEDRVLQGGEQMIRAADYVLVETTFEPLYEDQATFETVYDIMMSYGFRYVGTTDMLESPKDGRGLQGDALFVPRTS